MNIAIWASTDNTLCLLEHAEIVSDESIVLKGCILCMGAASVTGVETEGPNHCSHFPVITLVITFIILAVTQASPCIFVPDRPR